MSGERDTMRVVAGPEADPRAESKRDAFRRLAEKRTNAVLERVRVLSNCANPYAYDYDEDDVNKIFRAIEQEVKTARTKFMNHRKREFRLE